jgi:hypothetical protein
VRGTALLVLALLAGCGGDSDELGNTPFVPVQVTPTPTVVPSATPAETPRPCLAVSYVPQVFYYPGCYRLTKDLAVQNPSGPTLRAAVRDVEIDLNGFELSCEGCGAHFAQIGVSSHKASNVRVHNGRVRGFTFGVWLDDEGYDRIAVDDPDAASNLQVEDLEVIDSTFRGIRVEARDAVVKDCTVRGTGPASPDESLVMGIEMYGPRPEVSGNSVFGTQAPAGGEGVGISISDWGLEAKVLDNVITIAEPVAGADYGIWIGGVSDVTVARNLVDGYATGIAFSSTTAGEYFDNQVLRATNSYDVHSGDVTGDVPP